MGYTVWVPGYLKIVKSTVGA
eukprot:SAG11_NODE_18130_length_499_cov_0.835000_1_plen_20_part_10